MTVHDAGRTALRSTLAAAVLVVGLAAGPAAAAAPDVTDTSTAAAASSSTSPGEPDKPGAGESGSGEAGSDGSRTDASAEAGSGGLLDGATASATDSGSGFEILEAAELPIGMQPWLVRVAAATTLALAGIGVVLAATSAPRRPGRRRG
ncbi:hypothetical protein ACPYO6_10255 [Georgenia sp. Z1344]|uniref:hypothetical protein n=1 Tax=Georgenia sp. Z1344 TaxID=3416706 RepID=UPI003CE705CF